LGADVRAAADVRLGADVRAAAVPWAVSRVLVLLTVAFANIVVQTIGQVRAAVPQHMGRGLLDWDAERYLQIAKYGYHALPRKELRFFPLVPLLSRGFDLIVPGTMGRALLWEANIAALVLGVLVLRLMRFEKGDEEVGRAAVWLVFLTPAAFVLVWGYSEATWGCLSVGMFLCLRQRRLWLAAVLGVLAGLTRPVAPLLALAALVELGPEVVRAGARARSRDLAAGAAAVRLSWPDLTARAAAIASPVVGVGLYLAWVGNQFGDWRLPYRIQQSPRFRGSTSNPLTALRHTLDAAMHHRDYVAGLRLGWVVVLVALVLVAFKRFPPSYGVFAAAMLAVALSTEHLGSLERYSFSAFPVVLAAAVVAGERRERLLAFSALGAAALVGYGTLALLGSYVP
jgi:hypothetical protein